MSKKLILGLFGFGCVGQGLHRVLRETEGLEAVIKKICIKHPEKSRALPAAYFTTSANELLDDPNIDVIVELIDDADVAWEIVREAVRRGKHVVTANKRMVAARLDEIRALQKEFDRSVLYEGAVCGSIPIIRNLEEYYDNDRINRIEGIVNGSTNYILTKVAEEGKSYDEALREAQSNGFAESDPRLDVEGYDASFKLSILLEHAFGLRVNPEEIIRVGIEKLSEHDIVHARENGLRIKLVASGYRQGDRVHAWVAPKLVAPDDALYGIRDAFNAVRVEGMFAEEQLFIGKGAGGNPTGSAVLSDISALRYNYRYEFRKSATPDPVTLSNHATLSVRVGCDPGTRISPLDFVHFKGGVRTKDWHQLEGEISLEVFADWSRRKDRSLVLSPGAIPQAWRHVKQKELVAA
jgi:homoserine dehydrogenase